MIVGSISAWDPNPHCTDRVLIILRSRILILRAAIATTTDPDATPSAAFGYAALFVATNLVETLLYTVYQDIAKDWVFKIGVGWLNDVSAATRVLAEEFPS